MVDVITVCFGQGDKNTTVDITAFISPRPVILKTNRGVWVLFSVQTLVPVVTAVFLPPWQVNDYLFSVNGQTVLHASHTDAARIILMGNSTASLVVFTEKP
jgi:hypothetical protein